MNGVGCHKPGVPVNARPRVPPRVRLARVVDPHGRDVLAAAKPDVRSEIVAEADVPAGTPDEVLAVDPHVTVLIDPVKFDRYFRVLV